MRRCIPAVFATLVLASAALAQEASPPTEETPSVAPEAGKPAATEAAPKPAAPAAKPKAAAAAKPKPAAAAKPKTEEREAAAPLSQSKFLARLYAEIAKRSRSAVGAGEGEVSASFHVGSQGKIDKVTITKTSSPAHAALVKKVLAGVQAPPPPNGGIQVTQTFKFH
jgi:outer membrane biosynthesis protein TonB